MPWGAATSSSVGGLGRRTRRAAFGVGWSGSAATHPPVRVDGERGAQGARY